MVQLPSVRPYELAVASAESALQYVYAMKKMSPNKSKKKIFEICKQIDAQPDISLEKESSSPSESKTDESETEGNASNLLHSFSPNRTSAVFNICLNSKKTLTRNVGTSVKKNVVHDFEKREGTYLDTCAKQQSKVWNKLLSSVKLWEYNSGWKNVKTIHGWRLKIETIENNPENSAGF